MSREYEIIKAGREQMPEVARVFRLSRQTNLPYLPELHTPEEEIGYFTDIVFSENIVYVAFEPKNKKIVGFIAFTSEWVNHLYLLPDTQRLGIGSRLLELAKDHAQTLDLWTFQKNSPALRFYEKHGFVVVKQTNGSENEEKVSDALLRWKK